MIIRAAWAPYILSLNTGVTVDAPTPMLPAAGEPDLFQNPATLRAMIMLMLLQQPDMTMTFAAQDVLTNFVSPSGDVGQLQYVVNDDLSLTLRFVPPAVVIPS